MVYNVGQLAAEMSHTYRVPPALPPSHPDWDRWYLCGLLLPGNVERDIEAIQHSLFRQWGFIQMLPPLLPLNWLAALPTMQQLRAMPAAFPNHLLLRHWQWQEQCLLLSVASHHLFDAVHKLCHNVLHTGDPPLPLVLGQGFLLALAPARPPSTAPIISQLPSLIHQQIRALRLVFLAIDCHPTQWWNALAWSELYSKWIKVRPTTH